MDLGNTPLANSYLTEQQLSVFEPEYPLHAQVCGECRLVQVIHEVTPQQIFNHYAYFSSYSPSWLEHSKTFAEHAIEKFKLGVNSKVVEVASNDGYLLQYFINNGINCIGVEPAANVAEIAVSKGVPTLVAFFGVETAGKMLKDGWAADLIISNNVLAHVPDINDFVAGIALLLSKDGVWSVEFPHLLNLINDTQFDTIYHEHYSYLSLLSVQNICAAHGLKVFDLEELTTHGGSLRLFIGREAEHSSVSEAVKTVQTREKAANLDNDEGYKGFAKKVHAVRNELRAFIKEAKEKSHTIAAFGAAAKGNTLLNFCGIKADDISFVVDHNPHKQDTYMPGSHIPVYTPEELMIRKPKYLLILPWNIADAVAGRMSGIREWGGEFVTAIPKLRVF